MTAPDDRETEVDKYWYVYGILPGDVQLTDGVAGIGQPPSPVELLSAADVAALISEVDPGTLGTPEDLVRHQWLLDEIARTAPVLPFRFGAVMSDRDAVRSELLVPYRDEFLEALDSLEGRQEYVVRSRYVEDVVLREVLAGSPDLRAAWERVSDLPVEASRELRIEVGEMVGSAIEARRAADTQQLVDAVAPVSIDVAERAPAHPFDAGNMAILVDSALSEDAQSAVSRLASQWTGRVEVRMDGPMAPYDFAQARDAEG